MEGIKRWGIDHRRADVQGGCGRQGVLWGLSSWVSGVLGRVVKSGCITSTRFCRIGQKRQGLQVERNRKPSGHLIFLTLCCDETLT